MKKYLKLLNIIVILIFITTIVACSHKSNTIEIPEEEPIELTFFYPIQVGGPLTGFIEGLVEEFTNDNPNITIKPVFIGNYEDTAAKLKEAKKDGKCPDFFVSLAADRFSMVSMDSIAPLDEFIERDKDKGYMDGFLPEFMEDVYVDGKIWSIPFQRSTQMIYYNKDAFREVGLNPEAPPTTWDELVEYSQKLLKKDDEGNVERWGVGMAFNEGTLAWTFEGFALQNHKTGGNIMSDDGKKVYFDTPENVEVLELWRDLQKEYKVMPKGVIEWADLPHDFLNGKYGIIYNTPGNLTNIFKKASFEFGTAFLPGNKQMGAPTGGGNFYICKDASQEKKEAAWKFIKFATQTQKTVEWSVNTGYIPTRKDAYKDKLLKKYYEELPQAKISSSQLVFAKPEFATYELDQIWEILNSNIRLAMNDRLTPEEALKKAQKEADEVLSRYNE